MGPSRPDPTRGVSEPSPVQAAAGYAAVRNLMPTVLAGESRGSSASWGGGPGVRPSSRASRPGTAIRSCGSSAPCSWSGCSAPRFFITWSGRPTPTSQPGAIRSGASGSCSSAAWTRPPRRPLGRFVALVLVIVGVGTAGLFTASLASILVERYLRRRTRAKFRDGGPPGPLQLVAARARMDPRGPRQDHPGQAPGRDHPRRRPRRSTCPTSRTTRPSTTSTSSRATRPTRSILRRARVAQGPLGRGPDRRPRGEARRRQDDPHLHRHPQHLPGRDSSPTSPSSAATRPTATT